MDILGSRPLSALPVPPQGGGVFRVCTGRVAEVLASVEHRAMHHYNGYCTLTQHQGWSQSEKWIRKLSNILFVDTKIIFIYFRRFVKYSNPM